MMKKDGILRAVSTITLFSGSVLLVLQESVDQRNVEGTFAKCWSTAFSLNSTHSKNGILA